MNGVWVLARKELRLLLRDRMAAGLLLGMPLLFILVLGLLLGESFGQKPDDALRISIVDLDEGPGVLPSPPLLVYSTLLGLSASPNGQAAWLASPIALLATDWRIYPIPQPEKMQSAAPTLIALTATGNPLAMVCAVHPHFTCYRSWSAIILADLQESPGIRLEIIRDREQAEKLIREHRRAAVLILRPDFTDRINRCSFLATPFSVNPFHREGVHLQPGRINLGVELLGDPTQGSAASIIEQVVQVSMLRVILPYMIGQAFQKLSEPLFIDKLGEEVRLPLPADFPELVDSADFFLKVLDKPRLRAALATAALFDSSLKGIDKKAKGLAGKVEKFRPLMKQDRVSLKQLIDLASGSDEGRSAQFSNRVGEGVQGALRYQFRKYDLTGMTWAALTRSRAEREGAPRQRLRGARRFRNSSPRGTPLPGVGPRLHGDVRLLFGADGRLGLRRGAPAGDHEAPASSSSDARADPPGKAAAVLPGIHGTGDLPAGGWPVAFRHALGTRSLVAVHASQLAAPRRDMHVAGSDGPGPSRGSRGTDRSAGGLVRGRTRAGPGPHRRLRSATGNDAGADAEIEPAHATRLGARRLPRAAQRQHRL